MKYILLAAAIIALVLGGLLRHKHDQLVAARFQLTTSQAIIRGQIEAAEKKDKQLKELADARTRYMHLVRGYEREINDLRNDITTSRRVLTVSADCPEVGTNTAPTGGAPGAARLDAAAEQAYFNLRAGIAELQATCELFRQELLIRHASQTNTKHK
jgi:hypothetical protein